MLVIARLAVRFVPATHLFAWADQQPRRMNRFAGEEAVWISWAVETIAAKPWMMCQSLPRALAAHIMLRRRGIACRLCLGVATDGEALAAHAWIELGRDAIVGGGDAPRFIRLAEFGGGAA